MATIDIEQACADHLEASRKLNELRAALPDEPTLEQREAVREASKASAAATRTYQDALAAATEVRATVQDGGGSPEQLEFRSLLERYDPIRTLKASRGGALGGVEGEVNSHLGLGAEIPISIWDARADQRRRMLQQRAVTPATMPSATQTVADVIPEIYAASDAERLQISMPSAGPGAYVNLFLGGDGPSAKGAAKAAAVSADAGTVTSKISTPRRIQIALEVSREDEILAGTDLFRMRLLDRIRNKMTDKLNQVMLRAGSAPEPVGLLGQTTDLPDPSPTVPATGAPTWEALFTALVAQGDDGIFSRGRRDRFTILRDELYVVMSDLRYGTLYPQDLASMVEEQTGGLSISDHLPAPASKVSEVIQMRGSMSGNPTPMGGAEMATWPALEITDIYTKSTSAVTVYTIAGFFTDVQVIHPGKYRRLRIRTGS